MNRNTGWYPTGSPTSPPPSTQYPWPAVQPTTKPGIDWTNVLIGALIVIGIIMILFLWANWNQPSETDTSAAVVSAPSGETPAPVEVEKEVTVIVEVPIQVSHEPCPSNWGQLSIEELNMLTGGECTVYIE